MFRGKTAPRPPRPRTIGARHRDRRVVEVVATALRSGEPTAILLGGRALREASLRAVARIAAASGAKVYAEVFPARMQRGAGLPSVERLAYFAELATANWPDRTPGPGRRERPSRRFRLPGQAELPGARRLPGPRTRRRQRRCGLEPGSAGRQAGAAVRRRVRQPYRPTPPTGELTAANVCQAIGAVLPERAIISDEAQTSGLTLPTQTVGRRDTTCSP